MRTFRSIVVFTVLAAAVLVAALEFRRSDESDPLFPSSSLTSVRRLSDYFAGLKNTRGDTDVCVFDGAETGGTVLVLGGTHPNEPAGFIAAVVLLENVIVARGRLIVVPRANSSAFTHTEPGEGHPSCVTIATSKGDRRFRFGCRFTNPLDQWPDPEVYLHYPSKQKLSGGETRNLNRAYPGRSDGSFTERLAFALTMLVKAEQVDLVIDLHEASPEYPVINAIVAHERAIDVAALANLTLQAEGLAFSLEPSPKNLHGLSHRELGDATSAMAILCESANIMQGRLRGRTSAAKILSGEDPCYLAAAKAGLLRVPYDSTGISMNVRVGRHLAAVRVLTDAMNVCRPDRSIIASGIPSVVDVIEKGVESYLIPSPKTPTKQP